ncbi:MAG: tetratricopeptide repeat protein [Candidatus Hodarchaeales archaeon]|jgi:tetratricopeptide (TPR) repeat protein
MDLAILAVCWDDISGPSIISLFPRTALNDPESVALQVYLASVTVFGQHGHSQRTEFSVPLLSLGQGITARVAFDSWVDISLRGKERPFFLAFITEKTTGETLDFHLNNFIFEYLDILKEEREKFSANIVWDKIIESISTSVEKEEFDAISFEVDSDYAIPRALKDLETAKNAWENLKDRNQLWIALRVANRLENVDDKGAGLAFSLAGQIFLTGNSYREAWEVFEKAINCYTRVRLFEKAGETSYFAGKSAYYLQEYEKAIDLIQAATMWIKDPAMIASLNYDMGIVLHEQSRYEEANVCFNKAVKLAKKMDYQIAAEYSSTFASRLMFQAEREREENPDYALGLVRRAAEQREEASQLLQQTDESSHKAATSLILAVSAYFSLGNKEKGVNLLEKATDLFIEGGDYISAGRSLYDGARMIRDLNRSYELLSRAMNLLKEQNINIRENRLLGLISFEKGQVEEQLNQFSTALKSYNYSLQCLAKSNDPVSDLIPIQIQYANTLFRMEDFEKAAELFLAGTKGLSTLPSTENIFEQKKKTLTNALISLRRASTAYHNAGIISLKEEDENRAISMFAHSVSLMIDWVENNTKSNENEVKKVVNKRISLLSLKKDLLLLADSKFKLDSMIKSLNITLQSFGTTDKIE